mgnify:CR=1 FL=1
MKKFKKVFNAIKRKLGFRNKSQNIVINIVFKLEPDMRELFFEVPISGEDNLHDK